MNKHKSESYSSLTQGLQLYTEREDVFQTKAGSFIST